MLIGEESKRGRGTTKRPVFGILTRRGKVFARLVDDTEAYDLLPIITKKSRQDQGSARIPGGPIWTGSQRLCP